MRIAALKEDDVTNGRMEKESDKMYRCPQMMGQACVNEERGDSRQRCSI